MPTALIADDEPLIARTLRAELESLWPELRIARVAHDGTEAAEAIEAGGVDVAFLDISMPCCTGLEVAQRALRLERPPLVVFVTAHDEHALAAFDAAAIDYVLKPVQRARLATTVDKLRKRLGAPAPDAGGAIAAVLAQLTGAATAAAKHLRFVRALVGHGEAQAVRMIPVTEIAYFEAADKYVRVVTRDDEALIRLSLKELGEQLDPDKFWQIHRAVIVNADHVSAAEPGAFGKMRLRLRTRPEALDVSRAYAHLFRQM